MDSWACPVSVFLEDRKLDYRKKQVLKSLMKQLLIWLNFKKSGRLLQN